jgi:hypothetical protein
VTWSSTISSLGRQWFVVLVGVVAAVVAGYGASLLVPPVYSASGTVLLLPTISEAAAGQNPFLALDNLNVPASIISAYLDSDDAHERIQQDVPGAEYTIGLDASLRGPVILVTVHHVDPVEALQALGMALDSVPRALVALQSQLDVPAGATINSMRLSVDKKAEADYSKTIRATVAAAGGVLGLTVLAAVGIDRLSGRRRRRSRSADVQSIGSGLGTPQPPVPAFDTVTSAPVISRRAGDLPPEKQVPGQVVRSYGGGA